MKKILAVLLATSSIAAFADTDLYIGGGAGAAWNNVQTGGFAFRINGGYNFSDWLAFELGTTQIAQSGSAELNQSLQFWDISAKGTLPLGDSVALYGQFGGAYLKPGMFANPSGQTPNSPVQVSQDYVNPTVLQDAWDLMAGVGMQYNVTKKVAVTLTDYYYFGSMQYQGNTNVLLGGVKYNF